MRSSTPAEPPAASPRKPTRRLIRRWLVILSVLMVGGCAGRLTYAVESATFYVPSRAPFETPAIASDVTIRAGGRATMHGWWLEAHPDVPAKGVILFCHGNAGRLPDHLAFVERFPSLGYDVLMFDYRGYGRSSRPTQINRLSLLRDARAAHDFLLSRGVDPNLPVSLLGHSMGAAIGSALVSERPDSFDAVVLVAPFSSFPRVASDFAGQLGWLLIPRGQAPEQAVASFGTTPVLLVHGGKDRVVRPYHSERIAAAATDAGVRVEVLDVPEATHVNVFDRAFGTVRAIDAFVSSAADPVNAATTIEGSDPPE